MIQLIRIELLKLRTTRTTIGLLGVTVLLTALDAVLRASRAGSGKLAPLDTVGGLRNVCTLTGFSMLMAILLGAMMASGEFRHATATLTYLTCPDRTRVLTAKAMTAALGGLIMGAVGAGTATAVALAFTAGHGYSIALTGGSLTGYAAGALLGAALLGALGAALGSLIRSQLAIVVGLLVWALLSSPSSAAYSTASVPTCPLPPRPPSPAHDSVVDSVSRVQTALPRFPSPLPQCSSSL